MEAAGNLVVRSKGFYGQGTPKKRRSDCVTKPTKNDFAILLMDCIHQAGEKSKLIYDPEEFLLRGEAEGSATTYLGNAYQE